MTELTMDPQSADQRVEELVGRLFESGIGAIELLTVYLGDKLGLYGVLGAAENVTATELAVEAGIDERYAREWLVQQAISGFVEIAVDGGDEHSRRYALPEEYRGVFLDPHSLAHMAPLSGFVVSFSSVLPRLVDAYRKGEGISYGDYGLDMRDSQGAFNRPQYEQFLADWIASLPDVQTKIDSGGAVRVADVGCGVGWSSIQLALNWPNVTVDGIDNDLASIEAARVNADEAGVVDRVRFVTSDGADSNGRYDLVTAFECVHDMSQPVQVLAAMLELTRDDGTVLIMDEKVDDVASANGDPVQRLLAAASVLHCLPAGRAETPSAATGTLLTRATMERYAREAGFSDVTVLPIEHDIFRFYRLDA